MAWYCHQFWLCSLQKIPNIFQSFVCLYFIDYILPIVPCVDHDNAIFLPFLVKRNLSQQSNKSESDDSEAPALKPRNSQRKLAGSQVKRRTPSLYDNPPCGVSNKRPNDLHFYQNMNGPDWKRLVEAGYDNLRIPPRRSRSTKSSSPSSPSSKGLLDWFLLFNFCHDTPHACIARKFAVFSNACYRAIIIIRAWRCMQPLIQLHDARTVVVYTPWIIALHQLHSISDHLAWYMFMLSFQSTRYLFHLDIILVNLG